MADTAGNFFVKKSLRTRDLTNFGVKLHDPVCPLLSKAWSASKHNVHDRKDKNFSFTLLKLITSEIFSIKKKETKQNGTGIHVKSTLFKTQDTFRTGTKCPGGTPSYKPYRYRPPQG